MEMLLHRDLCKVGMEVEVLQEVLLAELQEV
jgi:hypothetical protein